MSGCQPSGLLRRFAAITYDSILLLAVLIIATAIVLPLASGDAFTSNNILFDLYLLGAGYLYFTWQWVHGGQTLGMRAWKIEVRSQDGGQLNWVLASQRFICALLSWLVLAAGYLWALIDKDKLTLHDRLSKTRVVLKLHH